VLTTEDFEQDRRLELERARRLMSAPELETVRPTSTTVTTSTTAATAAVVTCASVDGRSCHC